MALEKKVFVIGASSEGCGDVEESIIRISTYSDGTVKQKCNQGTNNFFYFYRKCSQGIAKYCKGWVRSTCNIGEISSNSDF